MRAGHAELRGILIHQRRERLFGTCRVLGKRDRRIVAGLDDHAVEQILELHLAVDREETRRTVGARAATAPGVLADEHVVIEFDLAGRELGGDDVRGHHLRDRGWFDALHPRAALGQHLTAGVIHEHPAFRVSGVGGGGTGTLSVRRGCGNGAGAGCTSAGAVFSSGLPSCAGCAAAGVLCLLRASPGAGSINSVEIQIHNATFCTNCKCFILAGFHSETRAIRSPKSRLTQA